MILNSFSRVERAALPRTEDSRGRVRCGFTRLVDIDQTLDDSSFLAKVSILSPEESLQQRPLHHEPSFSSQYDATLQHQQQKSSHPNQTTDPLGKLEQSPDVPTKQAM